MPHLQLEADLAHFVVPRAQLSVCLIESLRAALADRGQADLMPVLEVIGRGAAEALAACEAHILGRRRAKRLRIAVELQQLARLGGPRARRVANRLADDLGEPSGAYPIYSKTGGL